MSFVDAEEEARKEEEKIKKEGTGKETNLAEKLNPNQTIFSYLERMITIMKKDSKSFESIATSLEKLAFDKKVNEVATAVKEAVKPVKSPEPKKEELKVPVKKDVTPKPEQKTETKKATGSAGVFQSKFPPELAKLLNFKDDGDYVKIQPKQFLAGDAFPKIAKIVRDLGGEYMSCGRDSHFKIKKLP